MEKTEEQKEHIEEIREGETRLDYQIRNTKNDLKLDKLLATPYRQAGEYSHLEEYGFGFTRGPMIRRGIWLVSKLGVLYLIKGFKRLAHSRKQA